MALPPLGGVVSLFPLPSPFSLSRAISQKKFPPPEYSGDMHEGDDILLAIPDDGCYGSMVFKKYFGS